MRSKISFLTIQLTDDPEGDLLPEPGTGVDLALVAPLVLEPDPSDGQGPLLARGAVQDPDAVVRAVAVAAHGEQAQVAVANPGNLRKGPEKCANMSNFVPLWKRVCSKKKKVDFPLFYLHSYKK